MMKATVWQTLKIILFAILFSVFVLFSVLALMPEKSDVKIRKEITVSASALSGKDGDYLLEISGALRNTTSKPVMIDRADIRIAGIDEPFSTKEPLILQPRTDTEIFLRETSEVAATSVKEVSVIVVSGETLTVWTLRNPAVEDPLGYAFLPLTLALLFLLLLIHAIIVRVYMVQEKRLKA